MELLSAGVQCLGYCLDKAPRLSIRIVIWILSSDSICQFTKLEVDKVAGMVAKMADEKKLC